MNIKTVDHVNYYLSDNSYIVGDNSTSKADGIDDTSYEGEIVIREKIGGKNVVEIAKHSFKECNITKVTIHAKIRSINVWAFCLCLRLEYINIPSTVTFIGDAALFVGVEGGDTDPLPILVEFNEGRDQSFYICW